MTNLSGLIERVEAATEGSRSLDGAIAAALRLNPEWAPKRHDRQPELFSDGGAGLRARTWLAPKFTASLDAAMTLVPEGWCFTVATYWCEGEDKPPFFADCGDLPAIKADKADATIVEAWAETPALALVAAALKARALQEKDIEHG